MSNLSSVPTRIKLGGGFGVAVIALLVAGVPFSAQPVRLDQRLRNSFRAF